MKFFEKNIIKETFFIPKDVTISGNIEGKISGRIEGYIKGDVKINGKVIVSESGMIAGSLKCYDLVVQGVIQGDVVAHNSVHLLPGGIIEGNVSSNSINVDSKANVKGNIKKTAEKSEQAAVANNQVAKSDLVVKAKRDNNTNTKSWSLSSKDDRNKGDGFW